MFVWCLSLCVCVHVCVYVCIFALITLFIPFKPYFVCSCNIDISSYSRSLYCMFFYIFYNNIVNDIIGRAKRAPLWAV